MKQITLDKRVKLVKEKLTYSEQAIRKIILTDYSIRKQRGLPEEIMPVLKAHKLPKQRNEYRSSDAACREK